MHGWTQKKEGEIPASGKKRNLNHIGKRIDWFGSYSWRGGKEYFLMPVTYGIWGFFPSYTEKGLKTLGLGKVGSIESGIASILHLEKIHTHQHKAMTRKLFSHCLELVRQKSFF